MALTIKEKLSYALGDGASNIAWRGISTFLLVFYTDVFGLTPMAAGMLLLVARFTDGISDAMMGIIGDRTHTKYGKFRPWLLWTAIPLGISLSLLFSCPDWTTEWKIVYAYVTYILFTLIYTANNIPYGALMAVMTHDDNERASLGSYRMAGAFVGGTLIQGALLFLVVYFGNVNPSILTTQISENEYSVIIKGEKDVEHVSISTKDGIAKFYLTSTDSIVERLDFRANTEYTFNICGEENLATNKIILTQGIDTVSASIILSRVSLLDYTATIKIPHNAIGVKLSTIEGKAKFCSIGANNEIQSFSMYSGRTYTFIAIGEKDLSSDKIQLIDQQHGYSKSMYLLSAIMSILLMITFFGTKERIVPPKSQKSNLLEDLKDLFSNKPWIILLIVGLLFNIYNSIKQGIIVIFFTHYLHNQLMSASYMIVMLLASTLGAMMTASLSAKFGKKNLFIGAMIASGVINSLFAFTEPGDEILIFTIGVLSEISAAMFPTLFYTMLGDIADYSEYKNYRRATGLIYSAGSFAPKFGGGIAGAIIGWILGMYGYNGLDAVAIDRATPAIVMLMSWLPSLLLIVAVAVMFIYPITDKKVKAITLELLARPKTEKSN